MIIIVLAVLVAIAAAALLYDGRHAEITVMGPVEITLE